MHLSDLEQIFNRALSLVLSKKKLLLTYCLLLICGVLAVFCRALAMYAGQWIGMSLAFLPIFLSSGILLALGVFLIRIYQDEVTQRLSSYRQTLNASWETMIGASYLAMPILLAYLALWIILGIFYLLEEIPLLGSYLGALLSFGPFLLILGSLVLCILTIAILFYLTPSIVLRSGDRLASSRKVIQRLRSNIFTHLLLLFVGSLPVLFVVGLLSLAASLTRHHYLELATPVQVAVSWFFQMIPFAACLTPAVIFFFNFAAEAHVLMHNKSGE
jgi:hypothetical protein